MSLRFRAAYGGLWRFVAVFFIGMAVALLLGLFIAKRVLPEVSGAMLGTLMHGLGL